MIYPCGSKPSREHRSTQNKIPARYALTPTPPPKKRKTTNGAVTYNFFVPIKKLHVLYSILENFGTLQGKYLKQNPKQSSMRDTLD